MDDLINNIKIHLKTDIDKLVIINTGCPWRRSEINKEPGWHILTSIAQNIDGIEEDIVSYFKIASNSDDIFNMYINKELEWVKGDSNINKLKMITK